MTPAIVRLGGFNNLELVPMTTPAKMNRQQRRRLAAMHSKEKV